MRTTEFKDTELGPIPKDWEVRRVGEIGEIVTGATPPRFDGSNWNGDFAWISARDFTEKYIENTVEKVTEKGKRYCRCLPAESVLVTCIASIGLNAICKVPCATNQQINAVVCHDDDPEYFYYAMAHAKGRFASLAGQTAVPIINKQQFSDFALPFPPLPEQRRIAAALGDVDKLIENLKKRVEKKRNLKRGAMQELLTGKRRLKGFTGAWVEKGFDEVFELRRNNTCARALMSEIKGAVHNLHYGDVLIKYGAVVDCEEAQIPFLTEAGGKVAPKDYLEDGDVVIADTAEDETAGKVVEVRGIGDKLVVSGLHTIFCRPRFPFAIGWLGYWMNSNSYHDQLIALMTGIKVLSLSRFSFKQTKIMIPPFPEQRAIAAVLSDMDAEIANLEAKLKKMALLKQGMMQDLLTGKVRLA